MHVREFLPIAEPFPDGASRTSGPAGRELPGLAPATVALPAEAAPGRATTGAAGTGSSTEGVSAMSGEVTAGASLVQCRNADTAALDRRAATERVTHRLT